MGNYGTGRLRAQKKRPSAIPLVLAAPYSAASHHVIGATEMALMKPTVTLINIARGGIVDDPELTANNLIGFLTEGKLLTPLSPDVVGR